MLTSHSGVQLVVNAQGTEVLCKALVGKAKERSCLISDFYEPTKPAQGGLHSVVAVLMGLVECESKLLISIPLCCFLSFLEGKKMLATCPLLLTIVHLPNSLSEQRLRCNVEQLDILGNTLFQEVLVVSVSDVCAQNVVHEGHTLPCVESRCRGGDSCCFLGFVNPTVGDSSLTAVRTTSVECRVHKIVDVMKIPLPQDKVQCAACG